MELKGSLSNFGIEEILHFLNRLKRTGVLKIEGVNFKGEKVKGKIYFYKGKIIHAILDDMEGEEVFFYILLLKSGNFAFESLLSQSENTIIKRTIDKDTEKLLFELAEKKEFIENIMKKLPSFEITLKINPNPPSSKISLEKNEWEILNLFKDGKSIKEVLDEASFSKVETLRSILSLFNSGLLKKSE